MTIFRKWHKDVPHFYRTIESHGSDLLRALAETPATIPTPRYYSQLRKSLGDADPTSMPLVDLLFDLYSLMDLSRLTPARFVKEIKEELNPLLPDSGQAETMGKFLERALSLDKTLGVAAKARQLWFDNERVYCNSRIITDSRPIFEPPGSQVVEAFVIMHELNFTYHPQGDLNKTEEMRLQLHSANLRKLQGEIVRALEKERSLFTTLDAPDVQVLSTLDDES